MDRDPHAPYRVYKADMSYFSGKFEAYLRYKRIPHEAVDPDLRSINFEVYQHTGFKKVPAVRTADGLWLTDTTPMIAWFEARYTDVPVLPGDPALAFIALLLEDYGDEWLWRPSMWWRWEYPASRRAAGWRIGALADFGNLFTRLMSWHYAHRQRQEWLWGDGVNSANAASVRDLYLAELAFMQAVLEGQPYLLGSHPSVADFGFFGSMFRHFGNDPDPAEVMRRRAPAVYEWTARLWNESTARLGPAQSWAWPEGPHWAPLFRRIAGDYLPYLQQNAAAWQAGRKRFDFTGATVSFPATVTTQYRVWCREQLRKQFSSLGESDRRRVAGLFEPHGGLGALTTGDPVESGLDERLALPLRPHAPRRKQTLKLWLLGQARN